MIAAALSGLDAGSVSVQVQDPAYEVRLGGGQLRFEIPLAHASDDVQVAAGIVGNDTADHNAASDTGSDGHELSDQDDDSELAQAASHAALAVHPEKLKWALGDVFVDQRLTCYTADQRARLLYD